MTRWTLIEKAVLSSAFVLILFLASPAIAHEGRIEEIKVQSIALKGNLLHDTTERSVTVYLPAEYDEEPKERFPVVYLLHGYSGTNTLWTGSRYVKNLNIAAIADKLTTSGEVQPMMLVAPDCCNKYGGSWYTNSPVTGNWEDFVTSELIGYIDSTYRTIRGRSSRGIAGHSMGGHGAIKLAMKHPELFSAIYAMSPACVDFTETVKPPFTQHFKEAAAQTSGTDFDLLHWRTRAIIALAAAVAPNPDGKPFLGCLPLDANGNRLEEVWKKWLEQDLATTMLTKYRDNLLKFKAIALDCGTKDDLLPMNIAFSRALDNAGVPHAFEQFDGDHTECVASQLEEKVLPFFSSALKSTRAMPAEAVAP